jgi:hypothetical protein
MNRLSQTEPSAYDHFTVLIDPSSSWFVLYLPRAVFLLISITVSFRYKQFGRFITQMLILRRFLRHQIGKLRS